jgi:hypothetical protein
VHVCPRKATLLKPLTLLNEWCGGDFVTLVIQYSFGFVKFETMGCKQSKYAIGDEGQYMDGQDPYKGNPDGMDGMYPPSGIQTDIIPAHRYVGGSHYQGSVSNSHNHQSFVPEPVNDTFCPSDFQLAQMAEGCASGLFEMLSLGGNSNKLITNGPDKVNAYQQPAYNYQTPPSSEQSLGNHSQNSQRRAVLVQNGSFSL